MRKLAAALIAAVPLVALAQGAPPPPAPPAAPQEPAPATAPAAQPQAAPPQAPPAYTPPPPAQPAPATPPPAPPAPPPTQYAPPPAYAPPPQYAPPAPQYPPPPTSPPPAYQPPRKQRGTWYIGFGIGGGEGSVDTTDQGTLDFKDLVGPGRDTVALNFRVGATLSPNVLLGLDMGVVSAVSDSGGADRSADLSYFDAGVMFFPMERGLYFRGGIGFSEFAQELPEGDFSANGYNVLGGVGYAFWLGRTFNLTLNLDAQRHFFDEANVEGGVAWSAWVGFDWY